MRLRESLLVDDHGWLVVVVITGLTTVLCEDTRLRASRMIRDYVG